MSLASGRQHYTVIYDVDAVSELVIAVKSKDANRSIVNAVLKLCEMGERLEPPHMKPLRGTAASGLRELRPKQGRSDWRAIYRRAGSIYVILAVGRHANFETLMARAAERARRYNTPCDDVIS
jgi:hypothetical protein